MKQHLWTEPGQSREQFRLDEATGISFCPSTASSIFALTPITSAKPLLWALAMTRNTATFFPFTLRFHSPQACRMGRFLQDQTWSALCSKRAKSVCSWCAREPQWGMYQPGSECTCQNPSASKEQRKTIAHLPTVVKLLLSREAAHYSIHKTARSCFISTSNVEIKQQRRYMVYLQSQKIVAYSKTQKTLHLILCIYHTTYWNIGQQQFLFLWVIIPPQLCSPGPLERHGINWNPH